MVFQENYLKQTFNQKIKRKKNTYFALYKHKYLDIKTLWIKP